MRNPLSKTVMELEPSGIRRFFDVANTMDNVISLGVGEPDFDTPWHIREEGIYSLEKGRTYYTSNAGLLPLRREISRYLHDRFDLPYGPDEILVTVGGSEAIDICMRAMLDPGDEVILPEPCFVSYLPCVRMAGGTPVRISLEEKDEFKLTGKKLKEAITDKTKILVMPFPNNPTGAIMTAEELQVISDICKQHDIFVMSDEIYSELSYKGKHVSIASIPGMAERTIVINGFSKSFAMTGWRLGYAAGPKEIIKQMVKIHQYIIMSSPTTSQYPAEFREMVIDLAVQLQGKVKDNTPVKTGHLRNEWHVGSIEKRGNEYYIEVYNNVEYVEPVEYGHQTRGGKGFVKGAHMMELSLQEVQKHLPGYLREWMNDFLNTHEL